jgi:galactose mutarotase-like enzyme
VKPLAFLLVFFTASLHADLPATDVQFIILENAGMRATIAPEQGGELSGFAVRYDGNWHELLYRAKDYSGLSGWRGKAPLLWPATGVSLVPGEGPGHWLLDGKTYQMPPHGFARDLVWQVTEQRKEAGSTSVTLEMMESGPVTDRYPFEFQLLVTYRLEAEKLKIIYRVEAATENTRAMPFSIGNHITFKVPLVTGSEPARVLFHTELPKQLLRGEDRAFSGEVIPSSYRGWQDVRDLPHRNAVSLGGEAGQADLTVHDPSGLDLHLRHQASGEPSEPSIRFNLWADMKKGFFSPEPWIGTQNSLNSGAGLVWLEPGVDWHWTIEITPAWADLPTSPQPEKSP